jgi:hypothetical protein
MTPQSRPAQKMAGRARDSWARSDMGGGFMF